jgi:hypothetical protein
MRIVPLPPLARRIFAALLTRMPAIYLMSGHAPHSASAAPRRVKDVRLILHAVADPPAGEPGLSSCLLIRMCTCGSHALCWPAVSAARDNLKRNPSNRVELTTLSIPRDTQHTAYQVHIARKYERCEQLPPRSRRPRACIKVRMYSR